MSDETKASQDSFEEDLSRAAEEVKGVESEDIEETLEIEEPTEETIVETKEDDEDNRERSRLGRKVKQQSDEIQRLRSDIEKLLSKMETTENPKDAKDPDELITFGEVESIIEERDRLKAQKSEKEKESLLRYQSDYASAFLDLNVTAQSEEIYNEMLNNFNEIITSDPARDAKINYDRARASVYEKKLGQKKINLKGEEPQGINISGKASSPSKKQKPLSAAAQAFLKKEGLDSDWAQKALSS